MLSLCLDDCQAGNSRQRRWTHDNSHLADMTRDHIHPWMNNAWYRYVFNITKEKDCYVCSHMPATSVHATLYGKPMQRSQSMCAASFAHTGYQSPSLMDGDITTNPWGAWGPGTTNGTCDKLFWVDFTVANRNTSLHFPVFMSRGNHPICYQQRQGTRALGNTTNCIKTRRDNGGGVAPVHSTKASNGFKVWRGCVVSERISFYLQAGLESALPSSSLTTPSRYLQ